jgi:hypothetical protein
MSLSGTSRLVSYSADTRICISAGWQQESLEIACGLVTYSISIRKARMVPLQIKSVV